MLRAQHGFRASPAGDADAAKVEQAYKILGIGKSATNAEVKTAYRRLMNRHHPDKIAASSPDQAAINEAERMTRDVRAAYDLLKMRRGIR